MSDNAALDPIRAASNENLISELISESYHYGATDEDPYDYPPITDRQDELLRRLAVPADQVAVSRACADRAEDWAYESRAYGPKGTWEAIDDKLLQELRAALAADQTDAADD